MGRKGALSHFAEMFAIKNVYEFTLHETPAHIKKELIYLAIAVVGVVIVAAVVVAVQPISPV